MPTQLAKITDLHFQPGDVVAFSGHGVFSGVIEHVTDSPISHVAIMFDALGTLMEATTLDKDRTDGSKILPLAEKLAGYSGAAWYLRLRADLRAKFDGAAFYQFCTSHDGWMYDSRGVARFELHAYHEDKQKLFCSELTTMAEQAATILPLSIDASRVSPADMVAMAIYEPIAYQILGELRDIPDFNSKPVV